MVLPHASRTQSQLVDSAATICRPRPRAAVGLNGCSRGSSGDWSWTSMPTSLRSSDASQASLPGRSFRAFSTGAFELLLDPCQSGIQPVQPLLEALLEGLGLADEGLLLGEGDRASRD